MLALARSEGQSIIINGTIEVKVVKWSRSSVRLAIQAPREVTVDRDEIWRKMNPGTPTPLEKAEVERRERFAREGKSGPVPAEEAHTHKLLAPQAGTFYTSAGPAGTPFVAVGGHVEETTIVGCLKAGETTIDLVAGMVGKVQKILVPNGQAVTAGQTLMIFEEPE